MAERKLTTFVSGFDYLEAPRWREGRLWVSDFYTHQVIAVDPEGRVEKVATVEKQPSGLGWLPDGRLLVVSMLDRRVMRREADGSLAVHADLSGVAGGPANDMVVDAKGRAYVGNFGFDLMGGAPLETAKLARVDADGKVSVAAEDLFFPNGMVITPDGGTLLVNETFGNRVSAFAIKADGTLGPRRDWAVFGPLPESGDLAQFFPKIKVAPDGCDLDDEGALWIADAVGNRVIRVAEGGKILDEISTGNMGVFACALGGPDRRTLFLCVAPDYHEDKRRGAGEAALWTVKV
ncbi:MAG TPA: SMP-30/gluconolactonase/LRE family protein [Syntrophales bacterium]|nr:SMP-30/gluconolactonase/LRE family protein [Syntrophales bacterium]HOM08125.1 SMP-30/gluconolactonase/LRE family protein [Syntrophales bacterium]HOO00805.1 SMP-30/gluconolactonase/LRE family protein [Syntrophales bacterium]HPC01965.1 SMP-30/gluconolactonase/LRE family protein [Syntrophales bacterium]HPQ07518.1 SMP-30/gluconolactonase/LRE family protein [Syntrophales bacterium]